MIDVNLENKNYAGSVFIPGSPDDPRSAWAWCNTETGVVNRVVRYRDEIAKSFGCGWLGHAGHVLEIIPPNEVRHFQLDRERRFRVVYMLLRERYASNLELFVKEILAPAMNQAVSKKGRKN